MIKAGHVRLIANVAGYWAKSPMTRTSNVLHWSRTLNQPLADRVYPWFVYDAFRWLETHLPADAKIFEWGSGASTVFFAQHASQVVSIEYDEAWHSQVCQLLSEKRLAHAEVRQISADDLASADSRYMSNSRNYNQRSFEAYVTAIDAYPDQAFDLIVVDGRARNACISHAMPKVNQGGLLLLDNSDRVTYDRGKALLSSWERQTFHGLVPQLKEMTETTIWRRP